MAERQELLSQSFSQVLAQLSFGRGLPDLHIGFVATDIGVGAYGGKQTGCSSEGSGGKLESLAGRGCSLSDDAFLRASLDEDGEMIANFTGSLPDAFSCMARMGEVGCEYEQPLEAMRRALDTSLAQNTGFLRPDAVLGVVLLTDEDDCSAFNPELFNPENPSFLGDDPNFRCFQTGVICDGDDVYNQSGLLDDCRPRENSAYVHEVDEYVAYLKAIKPRSEDRVVTAIVGDPNVVSVLVDDESDFAKLGPSCKDDLGKAAYPGIRLSAFVDEFADTGELSSLCDAGPAAGLRGMIRNLRQSMGTTCLEGAITDIDDALPGRQVECRVFERSAEGAAPTFFPECDNPGDLLASSDLPCYTIQTGGEACGDFRTQLALQIHGRSSAPHMTARLVAECRVDE